MDQAALHNQLAGNIVASIVKPPMQAGGSISDVLVLLESVVLGVALVAREYGFDERAIDSLAYAVKKRLAEQPPGMGIAGNA